MSTPPFPTERPASGARGGDQSGLRQYNERLILHEVRRAGALSRADIARSTGLSAQAVSVITARLEAEGFLSRGKKQRGRVGQPSTPLSLNPAGAYAVGVSVGRRVLSTLLIDFTGAVLKRLERRYAYPEPEATLAGLIEDAAACAAAAPHPDRLAGAGVAASSSLERWADRLGAPEGALTPWREIDIAAQVTAALGAPAYVANDVAAAALAELALGGAIQRSSALYIFLGALVGGAVVLDGRPFLGVGGAAGAIGFTPLGPLGAPPAQAVDVASLIVLERRLEAQGLPGAAVIETEDRPEGAAEVIAAWRDETADALARVVAGAVSLLDCEQVVVDGALGRSERKALLESTADAYDALALTGLRRPEFSLGVVGGQARTLGGAALPLYARFAPDPDLLVKF